VRVVRRDPDVRLFVLGLLVLALFGLRTLH
jgi:hypothetical protein